MHHVPPAKRVYWAVRALSRCRAVALSRCDRRQMFWRRWALRCWESQLKCWGINMDHHGSTVIRFPEMGGISQNDWLISWKIPNSIFKLCIKTRAPHMYFRKSPYEAPLSSVLQFIVQLKGQVMTDLDPKKITFSEKQFLGFPIELHGIKNWLQFIGHMMIPTIFAMIFFMLKMAMWNKWPTSSASLRMI